MVHHRRTHTVCVSLLLSTIFYPYSCGGGRVECRICKWKLLSVNRNFVAAFVKLFLFRDVGSSFSYIAPTKCK